MRKTKPSVIWPPPKYPPSNLYNNFTQNGEMPITMFNYFANKYAGSKTPKVWDNNLINNLIIKHKHNQRMGTYSLYEEKLIDEAITKYPVKNMDIAVIGSGSPWIEALVASKKPKSITTIEYKEIISTIPFLKTFTPNKFAEKTLEKEIKFDYVISYSSIEHSGLGRLGVC